MYCTIQEAWGNNQIQENFEEKVSDTDVKNYIAWKNNELDDCKKIMDHIKVCTKCKSYYNLNSILENLNINLIDKDNKELVVMFLVGILLILIFHLFI